MFFLRAWFIGSFGGGAVLVSSEAARSSRVAFTRVFFFFF